MARASTIYKPDTKKGPVILLPSDTPRGTVTIKTKDGRTFTGRYLNTKNGRHQYSFPRELKGMQNLEVSANGESGIIKDGSQGHEGGGLSDLRPQGGGPIGKPRDAIGTAGGGVATDTIGGTGTTGNTSGAADIADTAAQGATQAGGRPIVDPSTNGTGSSVNTVSAPEGVAFPVAGASPPFPTINAQPIPQTQVPFVNPRAETPRYAADNAEQLGENFGTASSEATSLTNLDAANIRSFAPQASATQQSVATGENAFNETQVANANTANEPTIRAANKGNQADRLQQLDAALPGARDTILKQISNNKTLSEGRFLSDAEDRAFEVAARGTAADTATSRGFGDDSTVGKRTSDMLSAAQRLQLSQTGQAGLDRFLQLGANLAFDQPIKFNPIMNDPNKATISKDIKGEAPTAASTLAQREESRIDPLTTIAPSVGIGQTIGQNEFKGSLDQNRNQFNSSQGVQVGQFNATGEFSAAVGQFTTDVFNAQQQANAINSGHEIDSAQDNSSSGQVTGALETVGAAIITYAGYLALAKPSEPLQQTSSEGAGASDTGVTPSTNTKIENLGKLSKPLAISVAASGSGKSVADTVQGIRNGTITEKDLRKNLTKAGFDSDAISGISEVLKGGVTSQEAKSAMLIIDPATSKLAASDMLGDKSPKAVQVAERNNLRKQGSQIGLFRKNAENGTYYTRLADGTEANVSGDGKKKIQNFGTNVDGSTERSAFQIDWSDPRTSKAVGYYNSLGVMIFGKDADAMAGHVVNAAESNNNSLVETKANFRAMADESGIDYKTGLKLLARHKEAGNISESRYAAVVAGWNDLMLTQGVDKNVTV